MVARNGVYKTQVMYEASLSFALLNECLSFLVRLGLLEASENDRKVIYRTTSKGDRYVKEYEGIKHLLRKNEHGVPNLSPPFSFPKQ
jgi:predicted transcriptional regulator